MKISRDFRTCLNCAHTPSWGSSPCEDCFGIRQNWVPADCLGIWGELEC